MNNKFTALILIFVASSVCAEPASTITLKSSEELTTLKPEENAENVQYSATQRLEILAKKEGLSVKEFMAKEIKKSETLISNQEAIAFLKAEKKRNAKSPAKGSFTQTEMNEAKASVHLQKLLSDN